MILKTTGQTLLTTWPKVPFLYPHPSLLTHTLSTRRYFDFLPFVTDSQLLSSSLRLLNFIHFVLLTPGSHLLYLHLALSFLLPPYLSPMSYCPILQSIIAFLPNLPPSLPPSLPPPIHPSVHPSVPPSPPR